MQFDSTVTHTAECLAVSTNSDATGSYNRYEFEFGSNFPNYPKFGIGLDANYDSINVFRPTALREQKHVLSHGTAMLKGASAICF